MKQKHKWIFTITLFLSTASQGQLTKGNWLVGGTGKFFSYTQSSTSSDFSVVGKYNQIDISPSIGYFVVDKLAFGLKPTFSSINGKSITPEGISTNVQRYWIGPFGRYYFLNSEKQYNIVTDVTYQFGFLGGGLVKGSLATFSAN